MCYYFFTTYVLYYILNIYNLLRGIDSCNYGDLETSGICSASWRPKKVDGII